MIQYLTDAHGIQKAVQIPIKEWHRIEKELIASNLVKKLKGELKQAMQEVKQMEAGQLPKQTLGEFLKAL